jgi:alkylresorcinol/alkylpyrone synthase
MATIAATATAVPPHPITLDDAKRALQQTMPLDPRRMAATLAIFENARVERRYGVFPLEHVLQPRSLEQTTGEYREHAVRLGRRVAEDCLARAGVRPADLDLLITVSCTGLMIPSFDAYLINQLGLRADVRRLPITALGCAAGAAALSRASDFRRAFPEATVLVVAVELPTLTLQLQDLSQANLVSCALFGDGAAAAVVTGRHGPGARIVDTGSHLFPDSYDAMGFDLKDSGLHIFLSKGVPDLIRREIRRLVRRLLDRHDLTVDQLDFLVLHPGGRKLLEYIEEELGLSRDLTRLSWDVLASYGNLSSASVLFVLHETLERSDGGAGEHGLMAAFGPGFSAELLLLRRV